MTENAFFYYATEVSTLSEKVRNRFSNIKNSKTASLLAIFLLVIAIPLTVYIAQKQQEIRQQASTNQATITVNTTTAKPRDIVSVNWTLQQTASASSPTPIPPTLAFVFTGESNAGGIGANGAATAEELAPTSAVKILNNTTFLFEDLDVGTNNNIDHVGLTPNTHGFEIGLANEVKAHVFPNNPQIYLIKTGQGGHPLSAWAVGGADWTKFLQRTAAAKTQLQGPIQWVVWDSMGINDAVSGIPPATFKTETIAHINKIKADLPGAIIIMTQFQSLPGGGGIYNTVLSEIAASEPNVYVVDTTGASAADANHWDYQGNKTIASKMIITTKSALGTATPSAAITGTQSAITGAETMQLYTVADQKPVGPKMYLNCQNQTINDTVNPAPQTPMFTGQCPYEIPNNALPGQYTIRMLATDGTTILGESTPFTITDAPGGILTSGLVSYWTMDEATGNTVKDSIETHDGTASGAAIANGFLANARKFNGVSDVVTIGTSSALNTNAFTVSSWVNPTSFNSFATGNNAAIFNRRNSLDKGGLSVELVGNPITNTLGDNGQVACKLYAQDAANTAIGYASIASSGSARLLPASWNHIACSFDGTTIKLYIDGTLAASGSAAVLLQKTGTVSAYMPSDLQTAFGRNLQSGKVFDGIIDEIGYWKKALSEEEIKQLAQGTRPSSVPPPPTDVRVYATLTGIGLPNGTQEPLHPARDVLVALFDTQNTNVASKLGTLNYDKTTGKFTATINMSTACPEAASASALLSQCNPKETVFIKPGNYIVKIQTPQFLRKQIDGIVALEANDAIVLPQLTLTPGDVNSDNKINILDFNILSGCFEQKSQTASCIDSLDNGMGMDSQQAADINDDGVINGLDYNLFIRSLSTQEGD